MRLATGPPIRAHCGVIRRNAADEIQESRLCTVSYVNGRERVGLKAGIFNSHQKVGNYALEVAMPLVVRGGHVIDGFLQYGWSGN
jgi:hypothetical protein